MKWIDLLFHVEDDRSNGRFFLYEIYGREILILVSQPLRKFYVDSLLHIYLIDIQDQSSITNTAFLSIEILQFIFKTSLSRPIAVLYHIDSDKNKRSVGYNIVPLSTNGFLGLR